jgi:hypothetical protein
MKILLALLAAYAVLFGAEPKFKDYPAKTYRGDISKTAASQFGQELKINFGGKYYINTYACLGEECDSDVVIVDIESGEIYNLSEKLDVYSHGVFFYHNHNGFRFKYQANSYLLALSYQEGGVDADEPYRKVYFNFKDGEFEKIAQIESYPNDFTAFSEDYSMCESYEGNDPLNNEVPSEPDEQWSEGYDKYCVPLEATAKKLLEKYKNNKKVSNQIKLFMERGGEL